MITTREWALICTTALGITVVFAGSNGVAWDFHEETADDASFDFDDSALVEEKPEPGAFMVWVGDRIESPGLVEYKTLVTKVASSKDVPTYVLNHVKAPTRPA